MGKAHTITRRSVLVSALATSALAVPAPASAQQSNDDELVALAFKFRELVATALTLQAVANASAKQAMDEFRALTGLRSLDDDMDGFMAFHRQSPAGPAEDASEAALDAVAEVGDAVRATPASGAAGIWAKLIVQQHECGYRDEGERRDQDLDEERFNCLLDEVAALAGITHPTGAN